MRAHPVGRPKLYFKEIKKGHEARLRRKVEREERLKEAKKTRQDEAFLATWHKNL